MVCGAPTFWNYLGGEIHLKGNLTCIWRGWTYLSKHHESSGKTSLFFFKWNLMLFRRNIQSNKFFSMSVF